MGMSVEQFGRAVVASGAMKSDDIKALWAAFTPEDRPNDGAAFAERLVTLGKLTEFQAAEVLSDRATPLVLGNYVLNARLGSGGMGQVYKAQHRHMDRLVAIKVLPKALTKNDNAIKRFQREARAAARLAHPNIVQAHDASVQNGSWYLVMEYVDGQDLSAVMKQRGPLPVDMAVGCILQAARGLAYAHGEGVVHRDIKPSNLLLEKNGLVKILDMGLARFEDPEDDDNQQLTGVGQVMGTVDYMAPEQAASTRDADARSDIYSLGCTLYRLITGDTIYQADSIVKKVVAHMSAPIPSLRAKRPEVPAALEQVFEKMVAKRPADRFQATTQLVGALEAFCDGEASPIAAAEARAAAIAMSSRMAAAPPALSKATGFPVGSSLPLPLPVATVNVRETTVGRLLPIAETKANLETSGTLFSRSALAVKGLKEKFTPQILVGSAASVVIMLALVAWTLIRGDSAPETALANDSNAAQEITPPETPSTHNAGDTNESDAVAHETAGTPTATPNATSAASAGGTALALNTTPNASFVSDFAIPLRPLPPLSAESQNSVAAQKSWSERLKLKIDRPNTLGVKLLLVPPGEFLMGSSEAQITSALAAARGLRMSQAVIEKIEIAERPQHKVVITKPFFLSATEVTVAQFRAFVDESKYVTEAEIDGFGNVSGKTAPGKGNPNNAGKSWRNPGYTTTEDSPVVQVTWNDASAFCRWLSTRESATYRLPSEAEWEYACRAGSTADYCFGDDFALLDQFLWNGPAASGKSHPVGTRHPNAFGLHDMHANVAEWCLDPYSELAYQVSREIDPIARAVNNSSRVVRGGMYGNHPVLCRSAARSNNNPTLRNNNIGFRIVREHEGPESIVAQVTTPAASPSGSVPAPMPTASATGTAAGPTVVASVTPLPSGGNVPNPATKPDDNSLASLEIQPELEFMSGLTVPVAIGKVAKEGLPSGVRLIFKGMPKSFTAIAGGLRAEGEKLMLPIAAPEGTNAGPYEVDFIFTRGKDRKEQKVLITVGAFSPFAALQQCVVIRPVPGVAEKIAVGQGYTFQVDVLNINGEPLAVPPNSDSQAQARFPLGTVSRWIERVDGTKTITTSDTRIARNGSFYGNGNHVMNNKPTLAPGRFDTVTFSPQFVASLPPGKYRIVFEYREAGEALGRVGEGPNSSRRVNYPFEVVNP